MPHPLPEGENPQLRILSDLPNSLAKRLKNACQALSPSLDASVLPDLYSLYLSNKRFSNLSVDNEGVDIC